MTKTAQPRSWAVTSHAKEKLSKSNLKTKEDVKITRLASNEIKIIYRELNNLCDLFEILSLELQKGVK